MSKVDAPKTVGGRRALTTLTLKEPKRFVPGETYRLLVGDDKKQSYVTLLCTRQGELDLSVLELQEHNNPNITLGSKQICFRNPKFQTNYKPIKKILLARYSVVELIEDVPGFVYDNFLEVG